MLLVVVVVVEEEEDEEEEKAGDNVLVVEGLAVVMDCVVETPPGWDKRKGLEIIV